MKWLDEVKVINDKYKSEGIKKGDVGVIFGAEIVFNTFSVLFRKPNGTGYYITDVKVEDLKLVTDGGVTDEQLLSALPQRNPHRWCKLENGFILSLSGLKKNEFAYLYSY